LADVRPFRGLRYDIRRAGDPAELIAPPFDVISPEEQASLHRRSPHNIVRLELGEQRAADTPQDNRYTRAAACLREWLESGILLRNETPSFYLYEQEFAYQGQQYRRRALLGRVRLEEWEVGVIRPHEHTMAQPKKDRLELLRHTRVNVSPVFSLYRDPRGQLASILDQPQQNPPLLQAEDDDQLHTLHTLSEPAAIESIRHQLSGATIYIADGHHRYETALAYRDERRAQAPAWSDDEPENFVLMALTAADDPGLLLLPTHRLVRPATTPHDLVSRLARFFRIDDIAPHRDHAATLAELLARMEAARPAVAFGTLGLEKDRFHLLTLEDTQALHVLMPAHYSHALRSLDVSVLHYAVLGAALGIAPDGPEHEAALSYTEDAAEALRQVEAGRYPLAFLLSRTPVEQVLAVADAGERMPQKSTFFHPKLPAGLVMYALDQGPDA
jgi:uncharacterized protein (DUF1015 family)